MKYAMVIALILSALNLIGCTVTAKENTRIEASGIADYGNDKVVGGSTLGTIGEPLSGVYR